MMNKTTGVIIAAVTGAATGTAVALMSSGKTKMHKKCHAHDNSFSKTAGRILDTAGTVLLNMSDMLR